MGKPGDLKMVRGEGMPQYRNPFEKGRLIVHFNVVFPPSIEPCMADVIADVLPPTVEEPMLPDIVDEVDLYEFDPETDRQQQRNGQRQYDEDEEHQGIHGPGGVQCATQ